MNTRLTRRRMIKTVGATALFAPFARNAGVPDLPAEGRDTPKICLEMGDGGLSAGRLDEAGMRRLKQLGVDHVLMGGPAIPWNEQQIHSLMDRLKSGGLTLGNLMIYGFPNTLYGRPGRDAEIEKV